MRSLSLFFFVFFPLLHSQEALFPSTNPITYHIGSRVIDPRPATLFHLKGSEILTSFDYFSNRFKSVNYLSGSSLNIREILFTPKGLAYFKGDQLVLVDDYDDSIKLFNLRHSVTSKISDGFGFNEEYSISFNSFLDNDYLFGFGKTFLSVLDMNSKKTIASYNDSSFDIRSLLYFPEKKVVMVLTGESLVALKLVYDYENEKDMILKNATLSEKVGNCSCALERIPNTQKFLSYDIDENKLRVWDLNSFSNVFNISITNVCPSNLDAFKSFQKDSVLIICQKSNVHIYNISTETFSHSFSTKSAIVDTTFIDETEGKKLSFLLESGQITILSLDETLSSIDALQEHQPSIQNISEITYLNFFNYFKYEDSTTSSGLMAVRSSLPDSKTIHFLSAYQQTYLKNLTFPEEVRRVLKVGFSDYFLILHGNTIDVYNQTSLEPVWNITKDSIEMVDVLFLGKENQDLLPENNYIAVYSKQGNQTISLYQSTGELLIQYNLPETCQNVKLFCMMNNLGSWLYFTENDDLVRLNYFYDAAAKTSSITCQSLEQHIDNVTRCKSQVSSYNDNKFEVYNNDTLKVTGGEQKTFEKQAFSQITALTSGEFLLYDKNKSLSTVMTSNFEKKAIDLNSIKLNQNFKDSIVLQNKNFYYTGFFYNDQESYEILLEKKCGDLETYDFMGVCVKLDCGKYLNESTTNSVESCQNDSYLVDNYLGTKKAGCRRCAMDIPNCVSCSSAHNCLQCESNYIKVGSKENKEEYSFCLSGEVVKETEIQTLILKNGNYERCDKIYPNCQECDLKACLKCESLHFLNNSTQLCESCLAPKSHIKKLSDGSTICEKCSDLIEKCDECSTPTTCTRCQSSFYFDEIQHTCISCDKDLNPDRYPFGSNDGTGVCRLCSTAMANCVSCNGDKNNCHKCDAGYYLNANGKCTQCTDSSEFVDNSTNSCVSCVDLLRNCETCNRTTKTCTKCKPSFFLDKNNDCVSCERTTGYKEGKPDGTGHCLECNTTLSNCDICDNSTACSKCSENFYLDGGYQCVECKEDTKFRRGNTDGFGQCVDCSSKIQHCIKCSGDENKCDLCSQGHFFQPEQRNCVNCDIEHYPGFFKDGGDDGTGKCLKCSQKMKDCEICEGNSKNCKKCSKGFYIGKDATCTSCEGEHERKSGGDEGYGTCLECSNCEDCSLVIENCVLCEDGANSQKKCLECKDGFLLVAENTCEKCSDECASCKATKKNCTKCNRGFFGEYQNHSNCMTCQGDNKFVENDVCYVLACPCTDLNNSVIAKSDSRFVESDDSLFLNLTGLCVKEGVSDKNFNPLIYLMTGIDSFDFYHFGLELIKLKLGDKGPENLGFTEFDYEDPEWKMFGVIRNNSVSIPVRYNFTYKLKYYCFNDFGGSKANEKFGLVEFFTPKNDASPVKIFMNFLNFTKIKGSQIVSKISKMVCVLEKMANLSGKKLIKTVYLGETITCQSHKRTLRMLKSDSQSTYNPETLIFDVGGDYLKKNDNTSRIIDNLIKEHAFTHKFNELLRKELVLISPLNVNQVPTLNSVEVVHENSTEHQGLPILNIVLEKSYKESAVFELKARKRAGLVLFGLKLNHEGIRPTFENLKEELNLTKDNFVYKQTFFVQPDHVYEIEIPQLSTNQSYTLFYALENLLRTNHSDVNFIKFSQATEAVDKKGGDSLLITYKNLILAACGGILLLILIMFVLYCIFKRLKRRRTSTKYNEFISTKDELENPNVLSKSNLEEKDT